MKYTITNAFGVKKEVVRDAHAPETVYVHTQTDETAVIERNKQIRSAELLPQGSRNPFSPDESDIVAFAFQFPTQMDWVLTRRKESELFAQLEEGGDAALRAAERLSILYPQYVTTTRRGDSARQRL